MEGSAMRSKIRLAALPLMVVVGLVLVQAPVASEGDREDATARPVDFRMAPLEQAKKINRHLRDRAGATETMTVMTWDGLGDGRHIIVDPARATSAEIRERVASGRFDSVSWHHRARRPLGSCDSQQDCEQKTEQMCKDAGHDGVDEETVQVTTHVDGSKTCSGDCNSNGAVAFVTCNPQ
jgi:hypothetical protein